MAPTEFTLFNSLPLEIRAQIWETAFHQATPPHKVHLVFHLPVTGPATRFTAARHGPSPGPGTASIALACVESAGAFRRCHTSLPGTPGKESVLLGPASVVCAPDAETAKTFSRTLLEHMRKHIRSVVLLWENKGKITTEFLKGIEESFPGIENLFLDALDQKGRKRHEVSGIGGWRVHCGHGIGESCDLMEMVLPGTLTYIPAMHLVRKGSH